MELTRKALARRLERYGVRIVEEHLVKTPEQALRVSERMGYPVVLKLVSREVVHKTEKGAVKVNLVNSDEVKVAFKQILKNVGKVRWDGMLVQKMAPRGLELIVGGKRDEQFGPLILFGLGGIYVEVLKDVAVRVCPIKRSDAEEMLDEIKGAAILKGARGTQPIDREALIGLLMGVSKFMYENKEICELDLNPIIAYAKGYVAVDVRVIKCVA